MKVKYKRLIIWFIGIFIFIAGSNIPVIKKIFTLFIDEDHYRYSNGDGSLTFQEIRFKQREYNLSPVVPKSFIESHPGTNDTLIYRLFRKNPLAFWRWREYFYDKRYDLPYKSWREIRKKRGYDLEYSNNWQDF